MREAASRPLPRSRPMGNTGRANRVSAHNNRRSRTVECGPSRPVCNRLPPACLLFRHPARDHAVWTRGERSNAPVRDVADRRAYSTSSASGLDRIASASCRPSRHLHAAAPNPCWRRHSSHRTTLPLLSPPLHWIMRRAATSNAIAEERRSQTDALGITRQWPDVRPGTTRRTVAPAATNRRSQRRGPHHRTHWRPDADWQETGQGEAQAKEWSERCSRPWLHALEPDNACQCARSRRTTREKRFGRRDGGGGHSTLSHSAWGWRLARSSADSGMTPGNQSDRRHTSNEGHDLSSSVSDIELAQTLLMNFV